MSNNAVAAYESGEKPFSKWTKADILEAIQSLIDDEEIEIKFNLSLLKKVRVKTLKEQLLHFSSWHHTSNYFNKTDFYSIDTSRLAKLTDNDILKMSEEKDELKTEEPIVEKWKCEFLEWSGTRKHPKAIEIVEIGEVRGDWFYRANGAKKKITANGFRFIEKIEA